MSKSDFEFMETVSKTGLGTQIWTTLYLCHVGLEDCLKPVPCKRPPPCLCSWSNDWSNSVLSDTESVSVMSLVEKSQSASQGSRGRLNATGGTRDLSACSKMCRDTLTSDSDMP